MRCPLISQVERRLESRKIKLNVPIPVAEWMCETGYDPMFGARPLQRLVQKWIMNPLAKALLDGSIRDGELVRIVKSADGVEVVPNHAVELK